MRQIRLQDDHAAGGQLGRVLAGLQAQLAIETLN